MAMHKKNGKPMNGGKKKMTGKGNGLTAAQKKLPPALQAAIIKKNKKKK